MSEKFNGFSQDEINKLSGAKNKKITGQASEPIRQAFRGQHTGIRRVPEKGSKSLEQQKKQKMTKESSSVPGTVTGGSKSTNGRKFSNDMEHTLESVDLERSMSKSLQEALFNPPIKKQPVEEQSDCNDKEVNFVKSETGGDESALLKLSHSDITTASSFVTINDTSAPSTQRTCMSNTTESNELNCNSPFKGISLKDFEVHRRMIEEQNKQKKEMLYKAIEHHSQKTAAEARKIEEIKSELAKLDNDLAVDVALLRKQIDNACINFSNIEKQYNKIEAQFLKAKMELHNASEKKELLTEHLCTVIAHNEDRKAQKLSELMEKVGLTPSGEYESPPRNKMEQ